MENKVIINLDEYLDLRDKVQKIDKLKCIGKIVDESERSYNPVFNTRDYRCTREVIISSKDLTEYINDILGIKGFTLKIVEDTNVEVN